MTLLSVRVTKKLSEAEDIVSFELSSADGKPLPPFSAGSHVDVHIKEGLVRQYSLCNDPTEQHRYLICVLRDPASRGGSIAMQDDIEKGDLIQISTPKNHFALSHAAHYLLFAGGIGVTPILCMAERLEQTGASFELHYSARAVERTAFYKRINASNFAAKSHFHFDTGPDAQRLNLKALVADAVPDTHLYVCGPGGFIDFVTACATAQGWAESRIHFEFFGAKPVDTSMDGSFEVEIASSGKTFRIGVDRSVTSVLADHGIDIPVSCEQGVCGTCVTRVLAGVPDHRDVFFMDNERLKNDQFTPCCSRAKTPKLVLDL